MFFLSSIASVLALASIATAVPAPSLARRGPHFCGQYSTANTQGYQLQNNLWGKDAAQSGSQCSGLSYSKDDSVAWHTSWSWTGAHSNVKSYANVKVDYQPKKIHFLKSIPTYWDWNYEGDNLQADVAYDMFTSINPQNEMKHDNEVMVWLAKLGTIGPISESGKPVAHTNIDGVDWQLYEGYNGKMHVFSFVATEQVNSYKGDLMHFINYLSENQGLDTQQYLQSVQAGTEAFTGENASLNVTSYSCEVN